MYQNCRRLVSTIDIDIDELNDLELITLAFRVMYICSRNNCKIFETGRGYHIKVYTDMCYDFYKSLVIRTYLYDDSTRLEFDIIRNDEGINRFLETLFRFKCVRKRLNSKKVIIIRKGVEREISVNDFVRRILSTAYLI